MPKLYLLSLSGLSTMYFLFVEKNMKQKARSLADTVTGSASQGKEQDEKGGE